MRKQYHTRTIDGDKYTWDVHRLVRLSRGLPVKSVPLSDIGEVDENWWYEEPESVPTPRSLAKHMMLVDQADLNYPII